jgi:hypothetical protein
VFARLQVSYVEIYNEVIQDLLAPTALTPTGSSGNLVAARAVYGGGSSNGTSSGGNSPRRLTLTLSEYGFGSSLGSAPTSTASLRGAAGDAADISVLGASSGGGSIVLYENAEGQIVMDGVTEVVLNSAADLSALLQKGSAVRATASHK